MTGKIGEVPLIQNVAMIDDHEVAFFADCHHVGKNLRNHVFTKKVSYVSDDFVKKYELPTNEVRFEYIEELLKYDQENELKVSPHLKKVMLNLGNFSKMKVGLAKKVISKQTKSSIEYLVLRNKMSADALTTAKFIEICAHWLDIVSCKHRSLAFSKDSPDQYKANMDFLQEFMVFMSSVKFGPRRKAFHPFQYGALLSTQSTMWTAKHLLKEVPEPIQFFCPGRCLSDPIESLHGMIRSIFKNPTCAQYKKALKAVCVTQALKKMPVSGTNCEYDNTEFLADFKAIKALQKDSSELEIDCHYFVDADCEFQDEDFDQAAILASVASYILRQTVIPKPKCESCISSFVIGQNCEDDQEINCLIKMKEYKKGVFVKPSPLANRLFQAAEALFISNRDNYHGRKDIVNELSERICEFLPDKVENLPTCHLGKIVRRFVRFRCFKWGDFMNDKSREVNAAWIDAESYCSRTVRSAQAPGLQ